MRIVLVSVNAVQVNFADDMGSAAELPAGARLIGEPGRGRYIEERYPYGVL